MRGIAPIRGESPAKIDHTKLMTQLSDLKLLNDKLAEENLRVMKHVDEVNFEIKELKKELAETKTKLTIAKSNLEKTNRRVENLRRNAKGETNEA